MAVEAHLSLGVAGDVNVESAALLRIPDEYGEPDGIRHQDIRRRKAAQHPERVHHVQHPVGDLRRRRVESAHTDVPDPLDDLGRGQARIRTRDVGHLVAEPGELPAKAEPELLDAAAQHGGHWEERSLNDGDPQKTWPGARLPRWGG